MLLDFSWHDFEPTYPVIEDSGEVRQESYGITMQVRALEYGAFQALTVALKSFQDVMTDKTMSDADRGMALFNSDDFKNFVDKYFPDYVRNLQGVQKKDETGQIVDADLSDLLKTMASMPIITKIFAKLSELSSLQMQAEPLKKN